VAPLRPRRTMRRRMIPSIVPFNRIKVHTTAAIVMTVPVADQNSRSSRGSANLGTVQPIASAMSTRRTGMGSNSGLGRWAFLSTRRRMLPARGLNSLLASVMDRYSSGMPKNTASHSNSGISAIRVLTRTSGITFSTGMAVASLYNSGTASRVLPENSQTGPVSLRSTRSRMMSTLP
jgi:hypothetical protein